MIQTAPRQLLTIAAALERTGFGRSTLYDMHKRGVLQFHKVGRRTLIDSQELDRLIESIVRGEVA